jgi:hypothetical protein
LNDPLHGWRATVSITGQPDQHCEGADRDAVLSAAIGWLPPEQVAVAHEALDHSSWLLPNRYFSWLGGSVTIERVSNQVPVEAVEDET